MHRTTASFILLACVTSAAGCGPDYGLHPKPDESNAVLDDDAFSELCAEFCAERREGIPALCEEIACDVDVGASPASGQAVATMLTNGGNGVCEMLIECPPGECYDEFLECVEDTGNPLLCEVRFDDCVLEEGCAGARVECEDEAWAEYEACTSDTCWEEYAAAWTVCECEEEVCLTGVEMYCEEVFGAPPPMPMGPGQWSVSRKWIDEVLVVAERLGIENRTWPVAAQSGGWRGIRLGSLDADGRFQKLGARTGDLVQSVNGVPVTKLLEDIDALMALRSQKNITIGLRRAGKNKTLRYALVP